ncbi:hypothetical protein D3C77_758130 [compost metagenome]
MQKLALVDLAGCPGLQAYLFVEQLPLGEQALLELIELRLVNQAFCAPVYLVGL